MGDYYAEALIRWAYKVAPGEPAEVIAALVGMGGGGKYPELDQHMTLQTIFEQATEHDPRCTCGHSIWFHADEAPKPCKPHYCKCGYFERA